tara:strand:+ start:230 stop:1825 length:1596 start_codon:yes stop_codon:yes gene_type:complete
MEETTLSTSSSSTSSSKSQIRKGKNTKRKQQAHAENLALEELKKLHKNIMVRPLEDGFQFSVHGTANEPKNPEDVVAGNKRNYLLSYVGAMERMGSLEKGIDRIQLALNQRGRANDASFGASATILDWTDVTAKQATRVMLSPIDAIIYVVPSLHLHKELRNHPCTLVKRMIGHNGCRICCPVCRSNKDIRHVRARALVSVSVGKKKIVIDWCCDCANMNCPAVQSKLKEYANKKPITEPITADSIRSMGCTYPFHNSDIRLLHSGILPLAAATFYDEVYSRGTSFTNGALRRLLVKGASLNDNQVHQQIEDMFAETYTHNLVPGYLSFIQNNVPLDDRSHFAPPPTGSSGAMSLATMNNINDEMWYGDGKDSFDHGDRELVVRQLMQRGSGAITKGDGTFDAVRMLDRTGDHVAYVKSNTQGFILGVYVSPSEGYKDILLLETILAERNRRLGLPPTQGNVSDMCCFNSDKHASASMVANSHNKETLDTFHAIQRLTKTLVSANKLNVKPHRKNPYFPSLFLFSSLFFFF